MAVSQEYLNYIDYLAENRFYTDWDKDELLDELKSEWGWLSTYWREDKRDATDCLLNLTGVCYELLTRFTVYEWDEVLAAAKELHKKKNAGYSGTVLNDEDMRAVFGDLYDPNDSWRNFRMCTRFGISDTDGCIVRLCDKYSRFWTVYLNAKNEQVGESAVDTLRDLSAYALILVCLLEENND